MQGRGLKPQACFSTLITSWTKPGGAELGYHKLSLPRLVLSSDFKQITELRGGVAGPVLYLALTYQQSQQEPSGTVLKNLIRVGLGQKVKRSPRWPRISRAGGGGQRNRSA